MRPLRLALLALTCLLVWQNIADLHVSAAGYTTASAKQKGTGPGFVVHMTLDDEQLPEYGPSFKKLDVEVTPETVERLHVKIRPSDTPRWEVPESIIPRPGWDESIWPTEVVTQPQGGVAAVPASSESTQSTHIIGNMLYAVHQPFDSPGNPFSLKIIRKPTNTPIFDSTGHRFLFKDQFIELSTNVPEDADLFGLGEVTIPTGLRLPRDNRIITLYNADTSALVPYHNLYGSHPFLLQVNKDGTSHGVFFLNSNGMDVLLNKTSVTYRVIGGLVDLYFFLGPSPEAVIRQYHQVVGAPAMPPYWALGVHQGRWGYKDIAALEQVVSNYTAAGIPLESLWLDIEHQGDRFKTLTFNKDRFPVSQMRAFVDKLHSSGRKWVPIHDSAVAKVPGYPVYDEGEAAGVWIKDRDGQPYTGQVWPGEAVYPDYLSSPKVEGWIKSQLQRFYDQVPFDGLWLDMNEASNFCSGTNCRENTGNATAMKWLKYNTPKDYNLTGLMQPLTDCHMRCDRAGKQEKLVYPPYMIHHSTGYQGQETLRSPLDHRTISTTAVHADGSREYDAHNLFGTAMALRNTKAATEIIGKRPFFILRSTFPGAGRFTGHWAGDNAANWDGLFQSVASTLAPNMWGIAMSGADICGFLDESAYSAGGPDAKLPDLPDAEYQQLCNRWTSAGAFYPFARNHFNMDSRSHEPYRWPDVASAARKAYGMRYQLLTYLYSSMHLAHSHGGTLARPLFFTDPADREARTAEGQWMMGEALLVSPVLAKDAQEVTAYFTTGAWYSAWDLTRLDVNAGSQRRKLPAPLGDVPLHIRGGTIVPLQTTPALVTRDVRTSPITLVVALASAPCTGPLGFTGPLPPYVHEETCANAYSRHRGQLVSCGYVFMDGTGEDLRFGTDNSVQAWFISVAAPTGESGSISSVVHANSGAAAGKLVVDTIKVVGLPQHTAGQVATVSVGGKAVPSTAVEVAGHVMTVSGLRLVVGEAANVIWQFAAPTKMRGSEL